jgi:hypothetical protein
MWMWMWGLWVALLTAGTSEAVPREYWTALASSDQGGQVQFYGSLRVYGGVRRGRLACLGSCLRPRARIRIGLIAGTFAFRAKLGGVIVCTGGGTFDAVLNQGASDYACVQGGRVVDAGTLLIFRQ